MPDGEMIALIRPNYIGSSRPPYREWSFNELSTTIGGPNFIRLPDGRLWATGRVPSELNGPTVLAAMTTTFEPVLTLPCGGDSSYVGMIWYDDLLWMSYYSSHEDGTNIYMAKVHCRRTGARLARDRSPGLRQQFLRPRVDDLAVCRDRLAPNRRAVEDEARVRLSFVEGDPVLTRLFVHVFGEDI